MLSDVMSVQAKTLYMMLLQVQCAHNSSHCCQQCWVVRCTRHAGKGQDHSVCVLGGGGGCWPVIAGCTVLPWVSN